MTSPLVERHFLRRGRGVEFEMEVRWIRRHIPHGGGPIADVGCGIGALFDVIGRERVVGVDHQWTGLGHTRERYPDVRLVCGDVQCPPLADGSLDAITSQHVVEHLPAFRQACREWCRLLRPGGTLILLTPNRSFCDPEVFEDETHVHVFSHDDLSEVVRGAGFDVVDIRALGLPWFRRYHGRRGVWRLRRLVTGRATMLSRLPRCRWLGQTLCCAARRPRSS